MTAADFHPLRTSPLPDGGPVYHESFSGSLIAEPLNAFSSLSFWVPVIYYVWKLRYEFKHYRFILFWCAPLLFTGGLGSTLFHAFRTSSVFLLLDVIPISLLTLSISLYLWHFVFSRWYVIPFFLFVIAISRASVFYFADGQNAINAAYFITGLLLFIPAVWVLIKTQFRGIIALILSVLLFSAALWLRYYDDFVPASFPAGTHWLWHIACAAGAFALCHYLIILQKIRLKLQ